MTVRPTQGAGYTGQPVLVSLRTPSHPTPWGDLRQVDLRDGGILGLSRFVHPCSSYQDCTNPSTSATTTWTETPVTRRSGPPTGNQGSTQSWRCYRRYFSRRTTTRWVGNVSGTFWTFYATYSPTFITLLQTFYDHSFTIILEGGETMMETPVLQRFVSGTQETSVLKEIPDRDLGKDKVLSSRNLSS